MIPASGGAGAGGPSTWTWAAVLVPIAVVSSMRLGAVDLAYLLRAGQEMIGTRAVMTVDTFTFTAGGARWLNQQWLAEVIMAAVHSVLGWFGLALLRAALAGVTCAALVRAARARGVGVRGAAGITAACVLLTLPVLNLRPQLFGIALFALSLSILLDRSRHPGRIWWLLPIAAVWANVHGTFPLLFVLGGAALLEDLTQHRAEWKSLALVGALALAASLLNPFGSQVWSYVAGVTSNTTVLHAVDEWQPPSFASWSGAAFLASIPLVVVAVVSSRTRASWPWLLALAAFLVLGVSSTRGAIWWGLFAPVIAAGGLSRLPIAATGRPALRAGQVVAGIAAIVSLARWVPYAAADPPPFGMLTNAPSGITAALRTNTAAGTRVFNAQVWGSWFEYALPDRLATVDSRIELFPDSVWARYRGIAAASDGWQQALDAWHVDAIALSAVQQPALVRALEHNGTWLRVYQDTDGAVYVRR